MLSIRKKKVAYAPAAEHAPNRIEIRALWIDLHGTMVVPAKKLSKTEIAKKVAEDVLGEKIIESPYILARRTRLFRQQLAKDLPKAGQSGPEYWGKVNAYVYSAYGCSEAMGREISRRVSGDMHNFCMPRDRRRFFRWLLKVFNATNGMVVVMASNATSEVVDKVLRQAKFRDGVRVLTGDVVKAYKPSSEYCARLIEETGVSPEHTLLIGNSIFNDVQYAEEGVNVLWLRDRDESFTLQEIYSKKMKGVVIVANEPKEARRKIVENFVIPKSR